MNKIPYSTNLTWNEQNPSYYLFDAEVHTELQQVIKEAKQEIEKSRGGLLKKIILKNRFIVQF